MLTLSGRDPHGPPIAYHTSLTAYCYPALARCQACGGFGFWGLAILLSSAVRRS